MLLAAELFVSLAMSSRRVRDESGLWTALASGSGDMFICPVSVIQLDLATCLFSYIKC